MIRFENVAVSFGHRQIFEGLSFQVANGEKVALVGSNGTGKTTILKMLVGEQEPDLGLIQRSKDEVCYIPQHITSARISVPETSVLDFLLGARGLDQVLRRIQEIEVCLESGDASQKELDELEHLYEEYNSNEGYRAEADIRQLLNGVGLKDVDVGECVSHLSGGQRTKLMLCRMLYRRSDVLLLDEPTNHIEPYAVAWLASYLSELRKTVVVVSHNPAFLDVFVKRVISLEGTPTRARSYRGNYSAFLEQKSTRELSERRQQDRLREEIARQQNFIKSASQHQVGLKHSREKSVARLQQGLSTDKPPRDAKIDFPVSVLLNRFALNVKKASFSYGSKKVLEAVSAELEPTGKLAIIGQNGAGKSTLLKLMAGDLVPQRGTIERNSKVRIGWYRQEQEDLEDRCTILEEVQKIKADKRRARSVLAHFLFPSERLNQIVGTLSRGERARLCFAKLVLSGPNVLLLDEPTNHLDRSSREGLICALRNYEGAMVVVSHDMSFLKSIGIVWALSMPTGKLERVQ